MQKLLPQIKYDNFVKFLTSKEMIVGGVAILVTPLMLKSIESLRKKFPFFKDHFTIGMIVAAFIISIVAFMLHGYAQTIVLGIAVGVAITAIAPFFEDALSKIGGK